MSSIFIVFGESGQWDSYEKHAVAVFTEKEVAIDWAKKAQERVDAIYEKLKIYKDIEDVDDDKPFTDFCLFGPPAQVSEFYSDMSELLTDDPDPEMSRQLDEEWQNIRLEAAKKANPYDFDMTVDRYTTTSYFVKEFELNPTV